MLTAKENTAILAHIGNDPLAALESPHIFGENADDIPDRHFSAPQIWLRKQALFVKAFLSYVRLKDLWSALHSIIFVVAASLIFGRLPKMPFALLVFIPFLYLSALGSGMLALNFLRQRYLEPRSGKWTRKFFGQDQFLARHLRREGARLLRASFGVGIYLWAGLFYLALGPAEDNTGWLLMPFLLFGMMAVFSLNEQLGSPRVLSEAKPALEETPPGSGMPARRQSARKAFARAMLWRTIYMLGLVVSLYIMYRYLIKPFRSLFF